jgi:MOSC domain-containing protein YiiM
MKLVSVNTGMSREVSWHGRTVTTGIFKEPTGGRVALRKLNLDGDRSGGPDCAWGRVQSGLLLLAAERAQSGKERV